MSPEYIGEINREFEALRLGKRSQIAETVRLRKDGTPIEVSVKASPILDDTGQVVGASINARDIAERKKAKRLIEETGRMAHVGGWELDMESMTVIWTEEVSHIHEVPLNYIPNLSEAIDFYAPEERPVIQQAVQRAIDFGEPYDVEVQFITAKGNHRWVQAIGKAESRDGKTVRLSGTFQDITARKLAERALRESEAEFHTLAEAMPQIVWITDADGLNTYFNQHWMDYTGMTLEESLGHGWNKPFHPEDQRRVWDAWQQATTTSGIYSVESRLRRADGVYRWWLVRGDSLKDADGNILKWFGTCTDIHDLKMAQLDITLANDELRERDRRFKDMLGNLQLISVMRDREQRITYCNEYLLRLTGWPYEEVIGQNWIEHFVPPEIAQQRRQVFAEMLLGSSEARHNECEILTRSGERRCIRWNHSVLRSASGEVVGTASIGEDITTSKQIARELLVSQQRLEGIVGSSMDAIVTTDEQQRIVLANPAAENVFGYTREEILSLSLDALMPGRFRAAHQAQVAGFGKAEVASARLGRLRTVTGLRKNGEEFPLEVSISKIDSNGHRFYSAFLRDITEREKAEARIKYLNRVYAVLSGINTLIVRVHDRDELFREACRIAVETGRIPHGHDRHGGSRNTSRLSRSHRQARMRRFMTAIKDHLVIDRGCGRTPWSRRRSGRKRPSCPTIRQTIPGLCSANSTPNPASARWPCCR